MKFLLYVAAMLATVHAATHTVDIGLENVLSNKLSDIFPSVHSHDGPVQFGVIEDKLLALLEEARQQFGVGWPDEGIPPLDPFTLEKLEFALDIIKPIVKLDVLLDEIRVVGLKEFIVTHILFKIVGLTLELELTIPELVYTSGFAVDVDAANILHIHLDGNITLALEKLTMGTTVVLGVTPDGYLMLNGLEFAFNADEALLRIDGLFASQKLNNIINFLLSQVDNDLFQGQRENLAQVAHDQLFDVINEFLSKIKLSDIIG